MIASCLLIALIAAGADGEAADAVDPEVYFRETIVRAEATELQGMLAVLSATGDKELAPVFAALGRCPDPQKRQLGLAALVRLLGPDAADILLERLRRDADPQVRRQALGELITLEAIHEQHLAEALEAEDERIRCLAACSLAERGQDLQTTHVLTELVESDDPATADLARLGLLALGHREQLAPLREVLCNPQTNELLRKLLLEQIERGRIAAAAEIVREVARTASKPLRTTAYEACAAICPDADQMLQEAIKQTDDLVFAVQLLAILAELPEPEDQLRTLGRGDGAAAVMARFELARCTRSAELGRHIAEAMRLGHPIIVDRILRCAREDIEDNAGLAGAYAPSLLEYIRRVEPHPRRPGVEHRLAAGAAGVLADLGTREALMGLEQLLSGRFSARLRAVTAGLLESQNVACCELVRPLLTSPYENLSTNAALVLGYFADPSAKERLARVVRDNRAGDPSLAALASWYLLKIDGREESVARSVAARIR